MRKIIKTPPFFLFLVIMIFIILALTTCGRGGYDDKSTKTPYDPEKAGAVIVAKYDLTDSVVFKSNDGRSIFCHDLASFGDFLYIRIEDRIISFNKQTMSKEKEIKLKLPESYRNYANVWGNLQGLVVTDQFALILYRNNSGGILQPNYLRIYNIDLETGYIDIFTIDVLEDEKGFYFWETMGYDKVNNLLWFWLFDLSDNSALYFYTYDVTTETFIKSTTMDFFNKHFIRNQITGIKEEIFINGNDLWAFSRFIARFIDDKWEESFLISRRCLQNPYDILHEINLEYLGLDKSYLNNIKISESMLIDVPYIWIMVEIDNRIQLLKLLPNG